MINSASCLLSPLHIGTRPQGLWSPAVASQRSAGGAGGTPTMSTWSSPSPRRAPWTAAPANTFPTATTPTALTCLTLTLVRAHTQLCSARSPTYCTRPQTKAHTQQHTQTGISRLKSSLSAWSRCALRSDLLGLVWRSMFTQSLSDNIHFLCQTDSDGCAWMKHFHTLKVYINILNHLNDLSLFPWGLVFYSPTCTKRKCHCVLRLYQNPPWPTALRWRRWPSSPTSYWSWMPGPTLLL